MKRETVNRYLGGLDATTRTGVDLMRNLVIEAHAGLTEEIKWNAPSFSHEGRDRVTLGVDHKGGFRIVLHRGAKPMDASGFVFTDETKLAAWPAPDRGVVSFRDQDQIAAKSPQLVRLISRWIAATA